MDDLYLDGDLLRALNKPNNPILLEFLADELHNSSHSARVGHCKNGLRRVRGRG